MGGIKDQLGHNVELAGAAGAGGGDDDDDNDSNGSNDNDKNDDTGENMVDEKLQQTLEMSRDAIRGYKLG